MLVIEDHAYGMIRWKQAVDRFADAGMTFGNPDFVAYAQSYGARGHRVTEAGALAPTLGKAFAVGGLHLMVVPVDYCENVRVLVDELADMQHKGVLPLTLRHRRCCVEIDGHLRSGRFGLVTRCPCPPGSNLSCTRERYACRRTLRSQHSNLTQ